MGRTVFVVNRIQVTDGNIDNATDVFEDRVTAEAYLRDFVQDEMKFVEEKGWKVNCNTPSYFLAFEDGNLTNNYTEADLSPYTVKPHQIFNYDYQKEINAMKANLVSDIRRMITKYGKDNGNCIINDNEAALIRSALTQITVNDMPCTVDQVKCDYNIDRGITIISDGVVIEVEDYDSLYKIYNAVLDWFIDEATNAHSMDMLHDLCRTE